VNEKYSEYFKEINREVDLSASVNGSYLSLKERLIPVPYGTASWFFWAKIT
jgi:hypothetical protein